MAQSIQLEDLVDLELQLRCDEQEDPQWLRRRDAAIGQRIGADQLDAGYLPLAWLAEIRKSQASSSAGTSPGRQARQYLSLISWTLALLGFLFGASTVAGWLRIDPSYPVNALFFWSVVVGLQILLLCGWVIAVLPTRWMAALPGAGGLQLLLQAFGRLLPLAMGWLGSRVSDRHRQTMAELRATVARFDWLYGPIRVWLLIALTQSFAVSYNIGAVAAFIALTHGNDPAFCWKSTNLESNQIHTATQLIAWPWHRFAPSATLSEQDVRLTRFSSTDQQYADLSTEAAAPLRSSWKSWSLFLLASLITYGLVPRSLTWTIAQIQFRLAVGRVQLDHAGYQKLRDRLRRHFVDTRAIEPDEVADDQTPDQALPKGLRPAAEDGKFGPFPAVKCDGIQFADADIVRFIENRFGKSVASVATVLGSDLQADLQVLESLAQPTTPAEVFLLVEAWRPPVGEYLDLIGKLREVLGEGRMIDVLLCDRDGEGNSIEPKPRHAEMWQRKLAAIGDPWLRVDSLVEEPVA